MYANDWLIVNVAPNFNMLLMVTILKYIFKNTCIHQIKVDFFNQIPPKVPLPIDESIISCVVDDMIVSSIH